MIVMRFTRVSAVLAATILLLCLSGCKGAEGRYVGKRGQVVELNRDMTFDASIGNIKIHGTYKIEGSEITLTPNDKKLPPRTGKIMGDQLTNSKGVILKRERHIF